MGYGDEGEAMECGGGGGGGGGKLFQPRIRRLLEEIKEGMDAMCSDNGKVEGGRGGWFCPVSRTMEQAGGAQQMVLEGHLADVWSVAYSPD